MKYCAFLISVVFCFGVSDVSAQTDNEKVIVPLENISSQISRISKSLDDLNKKLGNFTETFNSNQGLRLSEKQRQILFAFEILNRAETRLSTLQLLKIQLVERETVAKRRIAQIDDSLRSENIDRTLNGTLDAEAVRSARRRTLQNERVDQSKLFSDIQNAINDTDSEISQTQIFLRKIRQQIFPNAEKELADL